MRTSSARILVLLGVTLGACRTETGLETGQTPDIPEGDASDSQPESEATADSEPDPESPADDGPIDADGDGAFADVDCDDDNAAIYPGATEVCDGFDNDCSGDLDLNEADFTGDGRPDCEVGACAPTAMTWVWTDADPSRGTVRAGCYAPGFACNPYSGNAPCQQALPLLCLLPGGLPNPGHGTSWSGGTSQITGPVSGCQLNTLAKAQAVCLGHFGAGYRPGEWHDPEDAFIGNHFWATGDWYTESELWVDINDQPNATCWTR